MKTLKGCTDYRGMLEITLEDSMEVYLKDYGPHKGHSDEGDTHLWPWSPLNRGAVVDSKTDQRRPEKKKYVRSCR